MATNSTNPWSKRSLISFLAFKTRIPFFYFGGGGVQIFNFSYTDLCASNLCFTDRQYSHTFRTLNSVFTIYTTINVCVCICITYDPAALLQTEYTMKTCLHVARLVAEQPQNCYVLYICSDHQQVLWTRQGTLVPWLFHCHVVNTSIKSSWKTSSKRVTSYFNAISSISQFLTPDWPRGLIFATTKKTH
jgi:hypothetical protein